MHFWARELSKLGYTVRAMPAQFVNPYVIKSNNNDANAVAVICEAVQHSSMRFARIKTVEQPAVLHLHRSRSLLLAQRVALSNFHRGQKHNASSTGRM